jgi:hypothetical protein
MKQNNSNAVSTALIMLTMVFIFIFGIIKCNAQEHVSVSVFQDSKLLLLGDEKGNNAGTANILVSLNLEGKQFEYYYFSMQPFYEYADLNGGYFHRYGVNSVWTMNKLFIDSLEASLGAGIGMIHRTGLGLYSYQFIAQLSYPITPWLFASTRYEIVRRSDLVYLWDTKEPFKPNFSVGVIFKI